MIRPRPAGDRGLTRTDWLESRHTFSFGDYYDPIWSGFRSLIVINEDKVEPSRGFGAHSHSDMEILSWVLEGALEHEDSTGASGILRPNELQRMTAGKGVRHSEHNPSQSRQAHFLQIWILPDRQDLKPEYEQRRFPPEDRRGRLRLLASPRSKSGEVTIHQDVRIYDAALERNKTLTYELPGGRYAWVQVLQGEIELNGTPLGPSDGAAVNQEPRVEIRATKQAELLLFDLA